MVVVVVVGGGGDAWVNFCWVCAASLLNPYLPELSDPSNPKNVLSHFSNSNENATPL